MTEQWEEFEGGPNLPRLDRQRVTLNEKGQIFVNRHVYEAMGRPEAAKLYFDRVNTRVGIGPVAADVANAFPFKEARGSHARLLYASPFCMNFGIRVAGTVAFYDFEIANDGMLKLDLKKTNRVRRVVR